MPRASYLVRKNTSNSRTVLKAKNEQASTFPLRPRKNGSFAHLFGETRMVRRASRGSKRETMFYLCKVLTVFRRDEAVSLICFCVAHLMRSDQLEPLLDVHRVKKGMRHVIFS